MRIPCQMSNINFLSFIFYPDFPEVKNAIYSIQSQCPQSSRRTNKEEIKMTKKGEIKV